MRSSHSEAAFCFSLLSQYASMCRQLLLVTSQLQLLQQPANSAHRPVQVLLRHMKMARTALQAKAGMQMTDMTMMMTLTVGSISMDRTSHMTDRLGMTSGTQMALSMKSPGTMGGVRSR